MSRLIDADVLYGLIEEKIFDSEVMCPVIKMTDLLELIDAQPTAYDIEKVVAELKAKENEWWDTYSLSSGFDEYAHGKSVGFEEAIEIVRKGGADK